MIKKIIALMLIFALFLSGCSHSDYIEPEDRTVVTAMLIGNEESFYTVILETLNVEDTENGEKYTAEYLVGNADSIGVAVENIQSEISSELSLYHCPLIICDNKIYNARKEEIFDFLIGNPQISLAAYLVLTENIDGLINKDDKSVFLGYEITDMLELKEMDTDIINILRGRVKPSLISADTENKFIFSEY